MNAKAVEREEIHTQLETARETYRGLTEEIWLAYEREWEFIRKARDEKLSAAKHDLECTEHALNAKLDELRASAN